MAAILLSVWLLKITKRLNNLLHLRVKMIMGSSLIAEILFILQEEGDSSEEEEEEEEEE